MKIIYVHHGNYKGGAPISLRSLMMSISKKGAEICLIDSVNKQGVRDHFSNACKDLRSTRIWYYPHNSLSHMSFLNFRGVFRNLKWLILFPISAWNLFTCIVNKDCDIVHFNSASLIFYGWIPKLLGIKLVCHIREPFAKGSLGFRRYILRKCLSIFSDKCIAICEDNALDTKLSNNQCSVIYNPIDFKKFDKAKKTKQELMQEFGIPIDSFVVLFAGGSNSNAKGLSDFLLSMDRIKQKVENLICLMPSFDLSLIDDDKLIPIYNKLKRNIIKNTFVSNIESWIGASDIVYALHKVPHFSRTAIEAGAMFRPVIAYNIGGINEVIKNEYNGILCPVNDIDAIVEATLRLYFDKNLSKNLSECGYKFAKSKFDSEANAEEIFEIYKSIIK
jgi:glycosyltransferase involved in cell wall biosynthesis